MPALLRISIRKERTAAIFKLLSNIYRRKWGGILIHSCVKSALWILPTLGWRMLYSMPRGLRRELSVQVRRYHWTLWRGTGVQLQAGCHGNVKDQRLHAKYIYKELIINTVNTEKDNFSHLYRASWYYQKCLFMNECTSDCLKNNIKIYINIIPNVNFNIVLKTITCAFFGE